MKQLQIQRRSQIKGRGRQRISLPAEVRQRLRYVLAEVAAIDGAHLSNEDFSHYRNAVALLEGLGVHLG